MTTAVDQLAPLLGVDLGLWAVSHTHCVTPAAPGSPPWQLRQTCRRIHNGGGWCTTACAAATSTPPLPREPPRHLLYSGSQVLFEQQEHHTHALSVTCLCSRKTEEQWQ